MVKKVLYIVLIGLMLPFGCKKECCQDPTNPDCENYNPCYGVTPANADFTMGVQLGDRFFEADTFFGVNLVKFEAKFEADSYHWIIGASEFFTRAFEQTYFPFNYNVEVTLITVKHSALRCYPNNPIRDTVRKVFYSWPETFGSPPDSNNYVRVPFSGTYEGYFDHEPREKREIELVWYPYKGFSWMERERIKGFPYPNTNSINDGLGWSVGSFFKEFMPTAVYIKSDQYGGGPSHPLIPAMEGFAWLDPLDHTKITLEYKFRDTLDQKTWYYHKFKGKKKL